MVQIHKMNVEGIPIAIYKDGEQEYISLSDITKAQEDDFFLTDWLRNANTLAYLGEWEAINNPNFDYEAFLAIRAEAGVNSFKITPKQWAERTNAIGIKTKTGRLAGVYANRDIALHFCMWISPRFQLYVIRELQRQAAIEANRYEQEWDVKRLIAKSNYTLHTDAIRDHVLPQSRKPERFVYANEADMLNQAVFGCTALEWRNANPERALRGENLRDMASIGELIVLSNLESLNSILIQSGEDMPSRYQKLATIAKDQLSRITKADAIKSLKRLERGTLYDADTRRSQDND